MLEDHLLAIKQASELSTGDCSLRQFCDRFTALYAEKTTDNNLELVIKIGKRSRCYLYTNRGILNKVGTGGNLYFTEMPIMLPSQVFREMYEIAHSPNIKPGAIDLAEVAQ